MKVKIGPYINYFGPYHLADLLKYVGVSEDKCGEIGDKLSDVKALDDFFNWIYSKRKRNIKVHIDTYDVWSMDSTLSLIVLPMLKKLKEIKNGSPMVDNEDVPEHLRYENWARNETMQLDLFADDNYDEAVWNALHAKWEWVLDEMIWTFEQKLNDNWGEQYWIEKPETDATSDKGPKDFYKWISQGELDVDAYNRHQARITNGFRLFGKYFEGLWD